MSDLIINDQDNDRDLDYINKILRESKKYGLNTEVVWSALNAMKKDPHMDLKQAITIGYYDWIK